MKDHHKFRAWSGDGMVYSHSYDEEYYMFSLDQQDGISLVSLEERFEDGSGEWESHEEWVATKEAIIEQCTGTKYFDEDGEPIKLVYQGDILKAHMFFDMQREAEREFVGVVVGVVVWDEDCFCWAIKTKKTNYYFSETSYHENPEQCFEYLGNIHQNPELLEE